MTNFWHCTPENRINTFNSSFRALSYLTFHVVIKKYIDLKYKWQYVNIFYWIGSWCFISSKQSHYISRSCKLPQLGPTLTLALSFTYSFTADSISLLTIWATWKKSGRYRDKESGMCGLFQNVLCCYCTPKIRELNTLHYLKDLSENDYHLLSQANQLLRTRSLSFYRISQIQVIVSWLSF